MAPLRQTFSLMLGAELAELHVWIAAAVLAAGSYMYSDQSLEQLLEQP
jgi:hypothetical protein